MYTGSIIRQWNVDGLIAGKLLDNNQCIDYQDLYARSLKKKNPVKHESELGIYLTGNDLKAMTMLKIFLDRG